MSEKWEEETIICPICMEHPHNAVLLICSSHEKGCRPFMCDNPQSNCFDQFRKSLPPRRPPSEGSRSRLRRPRRLACPLCRGSISGWRVIGSACSHPSVAGDRRRLGEDTQDRIIGAAEQLVRWRTPENMRAIEDRIGSLEPRELEEVRLLVRLYVASEDGGRRVRRCF